MCECLQRAILREFELSSDDRWNWKFFQFLMISNLCFFSSKNDICDELVRKYVIEIFCEVALVTFFKFSYCGKP